MTKDTAVLALSLTVALVVVFVAADILVKIAFAAFDWYQDNWPKFSAWILAKL